MENKNKQKNIWGISTWVLSLVFTVIGVIIISLSGSFKGLTKGELYCVTLLIWLLIMKRMEEAEQNENKNRKRT